MQNEIVLLGVLLSVLFSELTGLSPCGLIVPGYIALCLRTPERILYTLCIVALTYLCGKLLSRVMILYGRRRFALLILIAFLLDLGVRTAGLWPHNPGLIGVLVPGIMANEWDRQGPLRSTLSLGVVTGVLALLMLLRGLPVFSL